MKPTATADSRTSLSADDWAEAALDAIAVGGMDAVAVEPLARGLGVTKGSFYWHFQNRDALLRAALQLWERQQVDTLLSRIDPAASPYERIVSLFKAANMSVRDGRLYLAIAAAADNPTVQAFVQRLSERWISYLDESYRALGYAGPRARQWALFAFATFMGNLQVRRDTPQMMPEGQDFSDYVKLMIKTLIPREARGQGAEEEDDHPHVVPMRRPGS
ncbi:TetR/AcrR family transcriptional regulator [Solimonas sp. SE-A11]|uniref:TetR/AcrR family transcriptional regulator n=1 Tax=Solimonas sp. SE-A11 TaxID=3054954 RepID=UPI00259CEFC6|nr:TetR/AcrR family transcriptional regulator [Solimonas sp. SE-A11]MDM4768722.1 TetR/AcrR family transcriptional regulator [Solimonas sp. SE-A11]